MQGRIVSAFLPLVLAVAGVLSFLLAAEIVRHETADEVHRLAAEADSYTRLGFAEPGESAAVLTPTDPDLSIEVRVDGDVVARTRGAELSTVTEIADASNPPTMWPWDRSPITVERIDSATVVRAQTSGADLRSQVRGRIGLLAGAIATAVLIIVAATYPLTRWALRPVESLAETSHALAGGQLTARASVGPGAPELAKVADAFNDMADAMIEAVERERSFVADATHHLGNLLTPLRLRIEVLKAGADPHPAERALAEVDRIEAVVERLLAVARAENASGTRIAVDVGEAVDECIATWRPLASAEGTSITFAGHGSVHVYAVPGTVEEVVDLFIDNALKYATGRPLRVEVLEGVDHVRIVVRDQGPGMTPDELRRATRRFWRGAHHQSQPGSGLGLAVADALATSSGGRVELRSRSGRGLEAILVLQTAPAPTAGCGDDGPDLTDGPPLTDIGESRTTAGA